MVNTFKINIDYFLLKLLISYLDLEFGCVFGHKEPSGFNEISNKCEIVEKTFMSNDSLVRLVRQSSDDKNGSFSVLDSNREPHSIRILIDLKDNATRPGYNCLQLRLKKKSLKDQIILYDHSGVQVLKGHQVASFLGFKSFHVSL